ncbi:MAG: hypothetical protein KC486_21035, partial [Myxococcales bacterium]|nr:hypothetical protein [Myxococcales bacterium]
MGALQFVRRQLFEPPLRRRWLLALYTLALTGAPLVGTLGYENSVALTAPMSVLGVLVGVDAVRRAAPTLDAIAREAARDLAGLGAAALLVLLIAQLWHPSCDPAAGLLFLAMGPLLSSVLGATAGIVGACLVQHPPRRWLQALLGLVPLAYCLVVGLLRLYVDPAVYAFDPFFGYFAGPLYDEAIAIDDRYVLFRLYNLLAAAAALAAVRIWGEPVLAAARAPAPPPALAADDETTDDGAKDDNRKRGAADTTTRGPLPQRLRERPWASLTLALSLAGAAIFGLQPARFGFHMTVDGIAEVLTATRTSEHFIVRYAPTSSTAREIDVVVAELEFAHHRLASALGRAPQSRVEAFIFPDPALKRRTIGAARTEVAPPWRLQLYLNHQPFPAQVMPHELAHAFESTIGDEVFGLSGRVDGGARVNLALLEGFATAMAPRTWDGLDLHDMAAVLDRLELRPDLEGIMGLAFWGQASKRAYTAAGSFCLWLAETRGTQSLAALYSSAGDFEGTYGEGLGELQREWLAFLRRRELRPQDIEAMRQLFERRSIFQRPCAHRAADLAVEAALAQGRGDTAAMIAAYDELCAVEPDRPEHQIARATALAQTERLAAAAEVLRDALASPGMTATLRAVTHERLGDLALVGGDLEAAAASYREALAGSTRENQTRTLQIKLLAASDAVLSPYLRDYFRPFEDAAFQPTLGLRRLYAARRLAELPAYAPLGEYLTGLNLLGMEAPEDAAVHLERSLSPRPGALPLHSAELVRSARLHLVNALVRVRRYDRAEALLDLLEIEPGIGNGHRATYREWRARIDFFRGYRPTPAKLEPLGLPALPFDDDDDDDDDDASEAIAAAPPAEA